MRVGDMGSSKEMNGDPTPVKMKFLRFTFAILQF